MSYGEHIKKARKSFGLTQVELARKTGLATVTIQQYERNIRQPSAEKLALIAKALNTTVYEMIGNDWSGIDIRDAWGEYSAVPKTEKPAPIAGSGSNWDRLLSIFDQLSPEDQAELVSVAEKFAKASQHK